MPDEGPRSADAAPVIGEKRPRFFYGWVIVGVIALVGVVQTGQFNPTIGVFIKPVTEDFGWSRSLFIGAVSIGTLVGGVTALVIGPALDRYGPRWIVSIGIVLVGLALMSLAFVDSVWQFYVAMILGRAALQGAINLAAQVVVSKWFIRQRGRAIAISGLGLRIGNGTSPIIAQALLGGFGWRSAFFVLGAATWIVALIPAFLLLRRRPEDMGLLPDGDPPREDSEKESTQGSARAAIDMEANFTLTEALRTRSFYFLGISSFFGLTVASGVSLNLVPYLEDQGMSATTAVASITILSVVSMSTALASGFVGERVSVRAILTVTYVGMAIAVVFLTRVDTPFLSFVYAVFYGMLFGFMSTLFHMIYPDYFGRNSIGSIRGMTTPLQMGAIALGPLMASLTFDASGEYTFIFQVFAGLFLLSALFVGMAAKPSAPRASARHGEASAEQ